MPEVAAPSRRSPLPLAGTLAYTLAMAHLSLAEAKDKLSAVVNDVASTHEHYTITRNGRPVAVLLPIEDLESLEETIFWLEREVARLRAGEPVIDGPDTSGDDMAAIMERRRRENGPA
jgi:antitoxin YefM